MAQWTPPQLPPNQTLLPNPLFPRIAPYIPLIAIGVEIAWLLVLLMGVLFIVGDAPMKQVPAAQERARTRFFDILALLPALAGFSFGILVIARRWVHGPLAWTCLVVGCLGCGLASFPFASEFIKG